MARLLQAEQVARSRLAQQEEEWRLQNQTLLEELQRVRVSDWGVRTPPQLVVRNEELEGLAEEVGRARLDRITDDFCIEEEEAEGARREARPSAPEGKLAEGRVLRQLNGQVGAVAGLRSTQLAVQLEGQLVAAQAEGEARARQVRPASLTYLS